MRNCRACGDHLEEVLDLDDQCIPTFPADRGDSVPLFRLRLGMCRSCSLVQFADPVPAVESWSRSRASQSNVAALEDVARDALKWKKVNPEDVILDVGCNDGTLLQAFGRQLDDDTILRVGVDPCESIHDAEPHAHWLMKDRFSRSVYRELELDPDDHPVKIVTTVATLDTIGDPVDLATEVNEIMDDDGIWVIQCRYAPLMLKQNAFDHISAERVVYYSLRSLNEILQQTGFRLVSAALNDAQGGSVRVIAVKTRYWNARMPDIPDFLQTVGLMGADSLLKAEAAYGVNEPDVWGAFVRNIEALKDETKRLISNIKASGESVYGYGADAAANTLLQAYDLDELDIAAIGEPDNSKYGRMMAGSNVPIVSENVFRQARPENVIVFPWHLQSEVLERYSDLVEAGTRFIFPLPQLFSNREL